MGPQALWHPPMHAHARTHTQVNLAVQEGLMDAAVDADGLGFDDFVRMMRSDSFTSNASGSGGPGGPWGVDLALYDPRLRDASLHGPGPVPATAAGRPDGSVGEALGGPVGHHGHHGPFHPALAPLPDQDAE